MHPLISTIYFNSPIGVQNLLLSIYGYRIDKIRHRKQSNKLYDSIGKRIYFNFEELDEFKNRSFSEIVQLCAQNVPYYKELFRKEGIEVNDLRCIDDLERIPLLEKEELRKNPEAFVNDKYKISDLLKIHTTGTTGTPLNIYCNPSVRQKNYAFFERFLRHAKIDYKKKRATFGGRIVVPNKQQRPPFWRYSYFQKNLLFSSYHLRDETIGSYIEKLFDFQPHYIDSYPSSIYGIAQYALKHAIDLRGVTEGITTSAETLPDEQRLIIEEAFGVPVIDQYGAAEMCVFIGQCAQGSYHVHSDYAIVEFLRKDGSRAMPGEEAEVVCTGLINHVMPLIRYRIGDKVVVSGGQCSCGCAFPVVEKVIGRSDDVIVTPEGTRVGRLGSVLKGFPVKEAQYEQNEPNAVIVNLVSDDGYSSDIEEKLVVELRKRLGQAIEINIKHVDFIDRGPGGKFKTVVSTLT